MNSKTQIVSKPKKKIVTKLKNQNGDKTLTQTVTKLKKCEKKTIFFNQIVTVLIETVVTVAVVTVEIVTYVSKNNLTP